MNHLTSTLSLPLNWLSRFRFRHGGMIDPAPKQTDIKRFHLAFHRAYRTIAAAHPQWISRRFDADLLRPVLVELGKDDLLQINLSHRRRLTFHLASRWDAHFGCLYPVETRIRQIEELKTVASEFVEYFWRELSDNAE